MQNLVSDRVYILYDFELSEFLRFVTSDPVSFAIFTYCLIIMTFIILSYSIDILISLMNVCVFICSGILPSMMSTLSQSSGIDLSRKTR